MVVIVYVLKKDLRAVKNVLKSDGIRVIRFFGSKGTALLGSRAIIKCEATEAQCRALRMNPLILDVEPLETLRTHLGSLLE